VAQCATPQSAAASQTSEPNSLQDPSQIPSLEISLDEAINQAVQLSPVIRSTSRTLVNAPQSASTIYNPALVAANPGQGVEAALSAFDAQWAQQLFWSNVDQPQNQVVPGFTVAVAEAKTATYNAEIAKTTATGGQFAFRHVVNYAKTNRPSVLFQSTYVGFFEAEWRQPLLQGAGVTYNRIAGPNAAPGQYNGVLIARLNEDVALADFESSVINLVADVELAYWDLVTAYRVLDTNVRGRQAALQTFQYQQVRLEVGTGRRDEEAQARAQFYQFQAQVEVTLGGAEGLYAAEQRLRYLIGMAATDGRLLKPTTELSDARVVFDWDDALAQSLSRRVEVRKQRLAVKRREMELVAARTNLQPRLDLLTQYRVRGLGDDLLGDTTGGPLDNLYGTIAGGHFQEFQAGVEFNMPVGLRQASIAISHAKLNLSRERSLLAETELAISHDLSEASRQFDVTHQLLDTNYNRFRADLNQVEVLRSRYLDGSDNINFLLQAQRQVIQSATDFYRALAAYNIAIRNFHRQKGSLLAYNHVQLAEGPWAPGAAYDAYETGRFLTPRPFPESTMRPRPVTSGPFDPSAIQNTQIIQGATSELAPPAHPSEVHWAEPPQSSSGQTSEQGSAGDLDGGEMIDQGSEAQEVIENEI
jgi:outer membrane protein TolC